MGIAQDILDNFYINRKQNKTDVNSGIGATSIVGTHNAGSSKISEEDALSISSVVAATDLISSTIARLPIQIYKKGTKGEQVILDEDRRYKILNKEPNSNMSGINLKKRIVMDYLLHGNSYLIPEWNRNEIVALYHVPPKNVNIKKYARKGTEYIIDGKIGIQGIDGTYVKDFDPDELVIILKNSDDGLQSKGVLDLNSELLELALRQQRYSSSILENGSLPLAVLQVPTKLTEKAMNNIKNSWVRNYQGGNNAGKTVVLEEGVEYKPVSLNPNELDLTSGKKDTMSDIARLFNIPESMINADANKYNSNEQNNIHLLQYTLSPIISVIETAFERSLLLEEEKENGYRIQIDTSSILATTEAEKIKSTNEALKGGIISINEARRRHGYRVIDDDYMMWSLGAVFYNKESGRMTIPNMGANIDPNDPESVAKVTNKDANIRKNGDLDKDVNKDEEENIDNDEIDNKNNKEDDNEKDKR